MQAVRGSLGIEIQLTKSCGTVAPHDIDWVQVTTSANENMVLILEVISDVFFSNVLSVQPRVSVLPPTLSAIARGGAP